MQPPSSIVVFALDEQRFALGLPAAERAIRAVAITPLPTGPDVVMGVIDIQGAVVPVFDLRRRLGLPAREVRPVDQIVLARARRRRVGLLADAVSGVEQVAPADWVDCEEVLAGVHHVAGIVKRRDGLILIHDLDRFLSLDEERELDGALPAQAGRI